MKYLKKIIKIILGLFIVMILTLIITFGIDSNQTDYLDLNPSDLDNETSVLIKNVHVIPMTKDTVLRNKSVLIKNGKIVRVDSIIPEIDVKVIDGNGKYLSPGLIDVHVHVWDKQELGLYLANGVTAVRNAWGMPFHLRFKKQINNNELLGPLFITTTPKLTGAKNASFDQLGIKDPKHAHELINEYHEDGYDLIKTYAGVPEDIFDVVIEESEKNDMPIVAHPSFEVPYNYHFKKAIQSIEHTEDIVQNALAYKLDSVALQKVVNYYVEAKMAHTPTLTIYQNIIDIIEQKDAIKTIGGGNYMNPTLVSLGSMDSFNRWTSKQFYKPETLEQIKKQHQFHLYIVKQLHQAGVQLLCGTDAGIVFNMPGYAIHEELAYYLEAGLTPYEALKTATVNPSTQIDLFHDLGTIENTKVANLILSDKNPLEDISTLSKPNAVFVNGRYLQNHQLNELEQKAKNRKTGLVTLFRFIESLL